MRQRNLLRSCAALLIMAGTVVTSSSSHAKNDFESLLEDVDFGKASQQIKQTTAQSASDVAHLASIPQPDGMQLPQSMSLPAKTAQTSHTQCAAGGCADGSSATGNCSSGNCGSGSCLDGNCVPYMPPRLPNSTFYQMWRSSPCNVNVWDGYRRHCKPDIDLSIKKRSCASGGCGEVYAADCGPAPAEWCDSGSCD